MALVGTYFRDRQLQKALSILVSPGQANGSMEDALDILKAVDENNGAVGIGTLSHCQDPVAKWWSSLLRIAGSSVLSKADDESGHRSIHLLRQIVNCNLGGWHAELASVVRACLNAKMAAEADQDEVAEVCDEATEKLESFSENLTNKQPVETKATKEDPRTAEPTSGHALMIKVSIRLIDTVSGQCFLHRGRVSHQPAALGEHL